MKHEHIVYNHSMPTVCSVFCTQTMLQLCGSYLLSYLAKHLLSHYVVKG